MGSYTEWVCQLELINSSQKCIRQFYLLKYCTVMNKWINVQIFYMDSIVGFLGRHLTYMWLILDRAMFPLMEAGAWMKKVQLCASGYTFIQVLSCYGSWLLCLKQFCTTKPASMAQSVTVCLKKTFNFSCWCVLFRPRKCSPRSLTLPWNSLNFISKSYFHLWNITPPLNGILK